MKHTSVKLNEPVEFINITPLNPLISKCKIKVCYVSDEPNRNKSVITKEVAKEIANSIPGSPIVGFYNNITEDFEEHNRTASLSNGEIKVEDDTFPYGFVDLGAKVWFEKFEDDNSAEREYLMTEGYLWTGQYPECKRVIEKGNNQSMELDQKTLEGNWTFDDKGKPSFFIINKAIMSKLCILGEDVEPCFEGAQIAANFSLSEDFETRLFSMMEELKDFLTEGGEKLFKEYAVEIGQELWDSLYSYLVDNYSEEDDCYYSTYMIEGIFEEESQKFAVIKDRKNNEYFRLNIDIVDDKFSFSDELIEVTKTYVPAEKPQFSAEAVEEYEAEFAKKRKEKEEEDKKDSEETDEKEEDMIDEEEKKKKKKDEEEEYACGKKKSKYSVEEIDELLEQFSKIKEEKESLEEQLAELKEFKLTVERKQKQDMIKSFYMLSDDDKKDVSNNIDNYSLDEIEAKLSVICVRNKVNFALEEEEKEPDVSTTFTLDQIGSDEVPAWVQAAINTAEKIG